MRFNYIIGRSTLVCLMMTGGIRFSSSMSAASAMAVVRPKITMYVFNYAQVPARVLRSAEKETSRIFGHSRISIVWINVDLEADSSPRCALDSREQPCGMLRIHPRPPNDTMSHEIAGYAFPGTPFASIIFDAVVEEAKSVARSESLVLGHTMAHEIGHLFLPAGYHSPEGIMQARLNETSWRQADQGSLLFSSQEAEALRQHMLGLEPR